MRAATNKRNAGAAIAIPAMRHAVHGRCAACMPMNDKRMIATASVTKLSFMAVPSASLQSEKIFLRRGAFAAAYQFLKFRVVVQAIKIGVFGRPITVAVSGGKRLLERLERLRFLSKGAVCAGGIVEGTGIAGAKGDGGLQVPDGLVRVLFGVGEVNSQQDTRPHVFRHKLELPAERLDKPLLELLRFSLLAQPSQGPAIGDISIIVVPVGFESSLRKRRGLLEMAGREIRPAEDVPGSFTVGLALDGALGHQRGFIVFLLLVTDAGTRYKNLRQIGCQRGSLVAGRQSSFNPFRVLFAKLIDEPAQVRNPGMRQSEIVIQLDGLFEHLQAVVHIIAARVAPSAQVEIVCLRILRGFARDDFFLLRG